MGSVYRDTLQKVWGGRRELRENYSFLKISWTKQHLSDIRPQAFYMNQPSKATANKSGFLGSSSEIEQCLCGIPTNRMLLKSTAMSYLAFSSTEICGAPLTCYHVTCDLTFWNFETKKRGWSMCQTRDRSLHNSQLWVNVHWNLLFTEGSKESMYFGLTMAKEIAIMHCIQLKIIH